MTKVLLAQEAAADAKNCLGATPFHACMTLRGCRIQLELIGTILARGGDAVAVNQDGLTPLDAARRWLSPAAVALLEGVWPARETRFRLSAAIHADGNWRARSRGSPYRRLALT